MLLQIAVPVAGSFAMRNAGIVKIAPATSASPTAAVVRQVFSSRMVPLIPRSAAIAMTAAGNVAATVIPRRDRVGVGGSSTTASIAPTMSAGSVNSFMLVSAGT